MDTHRSMTYNTFYEKSRKNTNELPLVRTGVSDIPRKIEGPYKAGSQGYVLSKGVQVRVEQDAKRILDGKENVGGGARKNEFKSRGCEWGKESQMERRQEGRQGRVYPYSSTTSSERGLSRLCAGAQVGYGEGTGALPKYRGGSSS